jgi:hypothetical protein
MREDAAAVLPFSAAEGYFAAGWSDVPWVAAPMANWGEPLYLNKKAAAF